eukprot:m.147599 g.147599  ORF g.147599 m.147599 type:complete len:104 (-) comp9709_c1_seq5:245-556(-)
MRSPHSRSAACISARNVLPICAAQQGSLVDSLPDPPGYLARAAEVRAPARAAQAAANVGSDYRTTEEIRAQLSAARPAGPAGTAAMTPMLTPIRRRDATSRRL